MFCTFPALPIPTRLSPFFASAIFGKDHFLLFLLERGPRFRSFSRDVTYIPVAILVDQFSRENPKWRSVLNNLNNPCENSEQKPSIPLSVYPNKLEEKVKKRYVEKISAIGIDPVLIEGKNFEPDCLPPVESTDLLFYLVLETSY